MKVVITGGTGFIGQALTGALSERGDDVTVLTRDPGSHPAPAPGQGSVRFASWTPEHDGSWTRELEGADAVIHLAGAGVLDSSWTPERLREIERSRVVPAEILARTLARSSRKPKVFVSGSAVGYYGMRDDDTACTESAPAGTDELGRICLHWEQAAAPAADAGIRVVHPRTGLVLGRGGGLLAKMLPAFKAFLGGPIGSGHQYMPWIHMEDAVRAILFAIDGSLSGPVNVVAPNPVTMDEFSKTLSCTLHRPCLFRVPSFAAKLALGERSRAVLTGQRALPAKLDEQNFAFLFPTLRCALEDLFGEPA